MQTSGLAHSFRNAALVLGLAGAILSAPLLVGCGTDDADAVSSVDLTTSSDGIASSEVADSSSLDERIANFDYNDYLNEDGTWKDINVDDYLTLGDYKGITVGTDVTDVSQAAQDQIDALLTRYADKTQVTDRAVADDDTLNIDYVGKVDGKEFEGGSTQGQGTDVTIGVTQYIDDFLQQLVGHTPGETFDINVTFPDDYQNTDLAGKDATFTITINYIVESTTPELSDEWVATKLGMTYGWSSVQDMTSHITDELRKTQIQTYLLNTIRDSSTFAPELPESMMEYQEKDMLNYYKQFATMYGTSIDEVLPMVAGVDNLDALLEVNHDSIQTNIQNFLIIQSIAQKEGITVTDEDIATYLLDSVDDQVDIEAYKQQYGASYLRMVAMMDKVLQFVQDNAEIQLPSE